MDNTIKVNELVDDNAQVDNVQMSVNKLMDIELLDDELVDTARANTYWILMSNALPRSWDMTFFSQH